MNFNEIKNQIIAKQEKLLTTLNSVDETWYNGVYERYTNPILTNEHIPINWRYDTNEKTNPFFLERIGVNAVFNCGAIMFEDKYTLVARIEGYDRKSFFAVAQSESGVDGFKFWDKPIKMPSLADDETNLYDMRLTKHEDGYIYGLFCVEKKDKNADIGDLSSAVATCGIARTRDLKIWERLPDLKSKSQQRNVVLHSEFVDCKYALYTRPSDSFINVGSSGGIGFAFVDDMKNAIVENEKIIDKRIYHTIKETKNGEGPTPIKTKEGWLHIAHGVRNTCAGLRYVLYCFMTDLDDLTKVIASPGGYFIAPFKDERIGDVSNVIFSNGAIVSNEKLYIYYASSDTKIHVATTDIERIIDYCKNTPKDGLTSSNSVCKIMELIEKNEE